MKPSGCFLLDRVQVCYLDWKQRREQWKKTLVTFFWCHFCLQTSFQNSYTSAERVIDALGNAETCPAPWNRKTSGKFICGSLTSCWLCSAKAWLEELRGFLGIHVGGEGLSLFCSFSHHETICKLAQEKPEGYVQGRTSSNNGHVSASTRTGHRKGWLSCSFCPRRFEHAQTRGTCTSRVMLSGCFTSHQVCWWEQWLGHGSPTCNTHVPWRKGFGAFITLSFLSKSSY